jgi:polyisoprenoid-binding protein YceI
VAWMDSRHDRAHPRHSCERALVALVGLLTLLPGSSPAAEGPSFRVESGDVRVVVPLKPGGAFEAKTASLSGTLTLGASKPAPLSGELTVDLTTLDTGISLRNQHLRENYLEVQKGRGFDRAVLSGMRLTDAEGESFQGKTGFTGTLLIHGVSKPVTGTAEIRRVGSAVHVQAKCPLDLNDFAITPPEYMGVGVANKVMLKVELTASPGTGAAK